MRHLTNLSIAISVYEALTLHLRLYLSYETTASVLRPLIITLTLSTSRALRCQPPTLLSDLLVNFFISVL